MVMLHPLELCTMLSRMNAFTLQSNMWKKKSTEPQNHMHSHTVLGTAFDCKMAKHATIADLKAHVATSVAAEAGQPMNKKRSCRAGVTTRSATSAIRSGETVSVAMLDFSTWPIHACNTTIYTTLCPWVVSDFCLPFALKCHHEAPIPNGHPCQQDLEQRSNFQESVVALARQLWSVHGKQVASQMQKMMSLRSLLRPWRSQMLRLLYACMSCKFANVSRDPHEFGKNGSLVTTLVSGMWSDRSHEKLFYNRANGLAVAMANLHCGLWQSFGGSWFHYCNAFQVPIETSSIAMCLFFFVWQSACGTHEDCLLV